MSGGLALNRGAYRSRRGCRSKSKRGRPRSPQPGHDNGYRLALTNSGRPSGSGAPGAEDSLSVARTPHRRGFEPLGAETGSFPKTRTRRGASKGRRSASRPVTMCLICKSVELRESSPLGILHDLAVPLFPEELFGVFPDERRLRIAQVLHQLDEIVSYSHCSRLTVSSRRSLGGRRA